jgi:hypothetical protein
MSEAQRDRFIADIARQAKPQLERIAKHLAPDGHKVGHEWKAINPTRRDRHAGSFSINLAKGPWSDFATGHAGGDAVSLWAYVNGLSQYAAACALGVWLALPLVDEETERSAPASEPRADEKARIDRAHRLWREARDPRGSIVERYLEGRGLALPEEPVARVVRFLPETIFGGIGSHAAMVTAFRPIVGDLRPLEAPRAIQLTALDPNGKPILEPPSKPGGKAKKLRRTHGPFKDCAIKLDPDEAVEQGLGIAEGFETTLAQYLRGWRPLWALGPAGGLDAFPLLAGIECLTIFADHDLTGLKTARACRDLWREAGAEARIIHPKRPGADWGDPLDEGNHETDARRHHRPAWPDR